MQAVVHADLELWAGAWIRARAARIVAGTGLTLAWVSNTERGAAAGGPVKAGEVHVILRDDSGSRRDLLLKDNALGVTVLGYSRRDQPAVRRVAERLVAIVEAEAPTDAASPIADVPDVNGPYTVPSSNDEARLYAALSVTLVGSPL